MAEEILIGYQTAYHAISLSKSAPCLVRKKPPTTSGRKLDLHTHYYPRPYMSIKIRELPSAGYLARVPPPNDLTYRRRAFLWRYRRPMTTWRERLEDMDRWASTMKLFRYRRPMSFRRRQTSTGNRAHSKRRLRGIDLRLHPARFKGFASIPMDNPDAALKELHRAIDESMLNGVILLRQHWRQTADCSRVSAFFAEANRMKLCILLHPMLPLTPSLSRIRALGRSSVSCLITTLAVARMCFDGLLRDSLIFAGSSRTWWRRALPMECMTTAGAIFRNAARRLM